MARFLNSNVAATGANANRVLGPSRLAKVNNTRKKKLRVISRTPAAATSVGDAIAATFVGNAITVVASGKRPGRSIPE